MGLSNYKRMKRKLGLKKNLQKTPVIISKRNCLLPYSRESHLTLMHLWHLNHSIILGRIFCLTFIERCFLKYGFFLNSTCVLLQLVLF